MVKIQIHIGFVIVLVSTLIVCLLWILASDLNNVTYHQNTQISAISDVDAMRSMNPISCHINLTSTLPKHKLTKINTSQTQLYQETTTRTVYGHVHIAKTAGSTLNRNFSLFYENVCGHKGYSYDAFAALNRENKKRPLQDLYSRTQWWTNRIMVPVQIMDEIGYESCNWISNEIEWHWWKQFEKWYTPMELHIPCRSPLDHLLSALNHVNKGFRCDDTWKEQVDWILKNWPGKDRFSMKLLHIPNIHVKCIKYENVINGQYFESMLSKLKRRSITTTITKYKTNRDRYKKKECIWRNITLGHKIHNYMIANSDYYKWCDMCLSNTHSIA